MSRPRLWARRGRAPVRGGRHARRRFRAGSAAPSFGLPLLSSLSLSLSVVLALAVAVPRAAAQTAVAPEDVAAIARDLNCPVCQGYNLQDCPLEVCAQMRDLIRERLAAGETRAQIMDAFVADYGPQVLNAPPTGGVYWTAWLAPLVAFAIGVAVVGLLVARQVRSGAGTEATAPELHEAPEAEADSDYVRQLTRMLDGDGK